MSKKRSAAAAQNKAVSLERATRLYQLLRILASGSKVRAVLLKRLRIDIRTFYRDLEVLRDCRIAIVLNDKKYSLDEKPDDAVARLPFPDPNLNLGEVLQLAKGRGPIHKKLRDLLKQIMK
jgi:hypothetical protein